MPRCQGRLSAPSDSRTVASVRFPERATDGHRGSTLDARALREGPCWYARRQVLHWVDIDQGRLHTFDPATRHDQHCDVHQFDSAPQCPGGLAAWCWPFATAFSASIQRPEQMGHSSIQVTVDVYGHLVPGGNRAAVDRLDDAQPSATPAQPDEQIAVGEKPVSALSRVVSRLGIEPRTRRLRVCCSAN